MKSDGMRTRILVCAMCLAFVGLGATSSHAADVKAAKISLQDVFKNSVRVKNAEEDLRKIQFAAEGKISGLRESITKLREQLKAEQDKLKADERAKLENQLKEKAEELQQEQNSVDAKLTFKQKSLQNVMIGQIRELMIKIAKEEGYGVIYNTQTLLYAEGLPDLTQKLTQALDAMPAAEKQQEE
jgi:outer membrane protein